jgi:hypothetical protein
MEHIITTVLDEYPNFICMDIEEAFSKLLERPSHG